ncbi:MAG: hypothetical protein DA328_08635 [Nitrososphaeraceae archaeon]|nr:hypothetical protein [Nitrososphaeraceae archaeon]
MADNKKNDNKNKESNTKKNIKKNYFAKGRSKKTKTTLIFGGIAAAFAIALIVSLSIFMSHNKSNFGSVGSAHEHAAFLIKIDGSPIDFSQGKYQVKSRYIHVENNDGTTLHRHATGATFGDFLRSVGMQLNSEDNCFTTDAGNQYCNFRDNVLKSYLNGNTTSLASLSKYVINDNDRILVLYGNETKTEIDKELDDLSKVEIKFE